MSDAEGTQTMTTATEYMLAERVDGKGWVPLPQCGSWFTDRYYTGDRQGADAAWAALDRVRAEVPGTYTVIAVGTVQRTAAPLTPPVPASGGARWWAAVQHVLRGTDRTARMGRLGLAVLAVTVWVGGALCLRLPEIALATLRAHM